MLPEFHGLDLIIVLVIACLIFGPSKFLAISLKVSLRILLFMGTLIFGPDKAIATFRKVLQDFLKHLERLEQEKLTIPTFRDPHVGGTPPSMKKPFFRREVLQDFLKRWKRRL